MKPQNINNEEDIRPELGAALSALGQFDRHREARPEVEARLRSAFKARQKKRVISPIWAIAAAVILATVLQWAYSHRTTAPTVADATPTKLVAPPVTVPEAVPVVAKAEVGRPHVRPSAKPAAQLAEIATDFFPLVDYATPVDNGELVRVSLPASAMREVGLPVREDRMADRVQADVLMNNGMATAIRFVKSTE